MIGSLAGAAILLAGFVLVERRQSSPMFELGLLRVPTFVGGLGAALALSGSLFSLAATVNSRSKPPSGSGTASWG